MRTPAQAVPVSHIQAHTTSYSYTTFPTTDRHARALTYVHMYMCVCVKHQLYHTMYTHRCIYTNMHVYTNAYEQAHVRVRRRVKARETRTLHMRARANTAASMLIWSRQKYTHASHGPTANHTHVPRVSAYKVLHACAWAC